MATDKSAPELTCEGWWEQDLFGRQPMRDLRIRFDAGKIVGAGRDIVGTFTFAGSLSAAGQVAMVKRYIGLHSVNYVGTYDGEGLLWGHWHIGPLHNRWLIKIQRAGQTAQLD
jgi:hypothetical protein